MYWDTYLELLVKTNKKSRMCATLKILARSSSYLL